MGDDRPLGAPVDWRGARRPGAAPAGGRYAVLEPLKAGHGGALWEAFAGAPEIWDYMPVGPFGGQADLEAFLGGLEGGADPWFLAVRDRETGRVGGWLSLMRIMPEAGSIEIGYIAFGPGLQRSRVAGEALSMAVRHCFDLGYRRVEWKCNALNMASRRAAQRLGFSWEGIFRQHMVVKGRNRDTAWFSIIDGEWPALRAAHEAWLAPENFGPGGSQRQSLSALTRGLLAARDPALV